MRYAFEQPWKTLRENQVRIVKLMPYYAAVREVVESKIKAFNSITKGGGLCEELSLLARQFRRILSQSDALTPVCESPEHCLRDWIWGRKPT